MARIVTVYRSRREPFRPVDMSLIRWLEMSAALARAGHEVDMATREPWPRGLWPRDVAARLRRVPLDRVRWKRYDVVKTLFHLGFETLERYGGARHPFIISKLGSVVGPADREGVFFYGEQRRRLYETQKRVAASARYVTVLTRESAELWRSCHGESGPQLLLVPGGVKAELPAAGPSPYSTERPVCIMAGNIYRPDYQPEAHRVMVDKLNRVGRGLRERGVELHVMGAGTTDRLDPDAVTCHGPVDYRRSWDFLRSADVGLVLTFRAERNQNESTKIYHYLRVGLPTVCESGYPNEGLIEEVGMGEVVRGEEADALVAAVARVARCDWDSAAVERTLVEEHSWDVRARVYDEVLRSATSRR